MKRRQPDLDKRAALLLVRSERSFPLIGIAFPKKASQRGEFSLTTPTEPILDRFDCEHAVERMMSAHFCQPPTHVQKLYWADPPRQSTRQKEYHWYLVQVSAGCRCTELKGFEGFDWYNSRTLEHAVNHMNDTRRRMFLLALEGAMQKDPALLDSYGPTLSRLRAQFLPQPVRAVMQLSIQQ